MTMFSGHGLCYRSMIIAIAHQERLDLKMRDQSKLRLDNRGMETLRLEIGDIRGADNALESSRWRPRMTQPKNSDTAGKRKMSEMISEIGAGFISVGKSLAERQNRLTAVCSAWNMACASLEVRQR